MEKLVDFTVKELFPAYKKYMGNTQGCAEVQYLCEKCQQVFVAAWGRASAMNPWSCRGTVFYCTYCGHRHEDRFTAGQEKERMMPTQLRFVVRGLKSSVVLEVSAEGFRFNELMVIEGFQSKEVFRFDTDRRVASFRSEVQTRIAAKHGLKFNLGHCPYGEGNDVVLVPLNNIGFRMIMTDLKHIPQVRKNGYIAQEQADCDTATLLPAEWVEKVMAKGKGGVPSIQAIIDVCDLPNTALVRKQLNLDMMSARTLKKAYQFVKNIDLAGRFFECLWKEKDKAEKLFSPRIMRFLDEMRAIYGELAMVRMSEKADQNLMDTYRMWSMLGDREKNRIREGKIRVRDLHDTVVKLFHRREKKQRNFSLKVPEHIVRRMSMQVDRLSFFLPKKSMELMKAGESLHNCVGTYGAAVKDREKWVVLLADDDGKLVGCLEVAGNDLVQAKGMANKPVHQNPELNKAVLEWAAESGIAIKTKDVQIQAEEAERMAV